MQVERAYCYTCYKPAGLCVCNGPVVRNRTRVVILQHPRERQHPLGTERLARLGLAACDVQIAWGVTLPPDSVPSDAALLFPSDEAEEINTLPPDARPTTLIAIDGTWSQARSLYKKNPWLASLRHVKLTQAPPSNYRIRREPKSHYVSTLEALVHALRALEPDTDGFDALLAHFDAMIDKQLEYSARPPEGSYRHRKRKKRDLDPHPFFLDAARTPVVAYAEYVAKEDTAVAVHVCLQRIDGESLEAFVSSAADAPDDLHLTNMHLSRDQIAAGMPLREVRDAVASFVRPSDFLVAWSPSTLRILESLATWPDVLGLKGAYGNFTRQKPGDIEDILKRHELTSTSGRFSGRADARMGNASAIARWMMRR